MYKWLRNSPASPSTFLTRVVDAIYGLRVASAGSERFSLLICLGTTKFVWLIVVTPLETICPNVCSKSRLKSAESLLAVDVRRSKTSPHKLPVASFHCS